MYPTCRRSPPKCDQVAEGVCPTHWPESSQELLEVVVSGPVTSAAVSAKTVHKRNLSGLSTDRTKLLTCCANVAMGAHCREILGTRKRRQGGSKKGHTCPSGAPTMPRAPFVPSLTIPGPFSRVQTVPTHRALAIFRACVGHLSGPLNICSERFLEQFSWNLPGPIFDGSAHSKP